MDQLAEDQKWMASAIELALNGQGRVEPNPMVGCVIVRDGVIVGRGWHRQFGQAHAEVNALAVCDSPAGSTVYVTLEPCCHMGKTPPCAEALIKANVSRVVVATLDPNPDVNGSGIQRIRNSGIQIDTGILKNQALELIRPFAKRIRSGTPWVIVKWAMSLDGKIATSRGESQWISNEKSRQKVHQLRGRMDAIVVGVGTALADDPRLTARPRGPRIATRIVMDTDARIPIHSQLVSSARDVPLWIMTGPHPSQRRIESLKKHGCRVLIGTSECYARRLQELLRLLGSCNMTNVLFEGGGRLLGELNQARLIDEVHCFIAPKIIGGQDAKSPIGGTGIENLVNATLLEHVKIETLDSDIYVTGRVLSTEY